MKAVFLALFLAVASNASAQSLKLPSTVFLTTASADWTTTALALHRGGVERNALYAWAGPAPAIVTVGAASDLLATVIAHRLGARHPRLVTVSLYAASAWRVGVVAHNIRTLHRLK